MKIQRFIFALASLLTTLVQAQGMVKYEQVPLQPKTADLGILFIGGFMDEMTGIMYNLYHQCPLIDPSRSEQRAYYHWHGDAMDQDWPHMQKLLRDVSAFQQVNPQSPLVLIGHSMGAVAAFELANRMDRGTNPLYLVTLDPVDKKSTRQHAAHVDWWGHCYVSQSTSSRDFIYEAAGRWGSCPDADINLNAKGPHFIHDWAEALLLKRGNNPQSLFEALQCALNGS